MSWGVVGGTGGEQRPLLQGSRRPVLVVTGFTDACGPGDLRGGRAQQVGLRYEATR